MNTIDSFLNSPMPLVFKFDRACDEGPHISSADENYSDPPYLFEVTLEPKDLEVVRRHLAYAREHGVSVTIPLSWSKHPFGTYTYETAHPEDRERESDRPENVAVNISSYGTLQLEFSGKYSNVGYYATLDEAALHRV